MKKPVRRRTPVRCNHVFVQRNVCKVTLARGKYHHSRDLGLTARGDWIHAEYDARGRLIALEILGSGKPCQRSVARVSEVGSQR